MNGLSGKKVVRTILWFSIRCPVKTAVGVVKCSRSVVSDSATLRTVAHQLPYMDRGFSRQEYWRVLP